MGVIVLTARMWKQPKRPSLMSNKTECGGSTQGDVIQHKEQRLTPAAAQGLWKHFPKGQKPATEGHMYDSIDVKCPEQADS